MAANSGPAELARRYRGRFAPTPSGPLHFGSLVAAVGSYLEAKRHSGAWLVRIEDLDPPRVVPGAAEQILRTLEAFGFEWHGPVMWQSERTAAYRESFEKLLAQSHAYPCACSRSFQEGSRCAGNCRQAAGVGQQIRSWRVRVPETEVCWKDRLRGAQCDHLSRDGGDFVVLRADGVFAYQLAVVIDDAEQGITDVVRGVDLLDSTARQICLQRHLEIPTPGYLHLPVAKNERGEKLSKQTRAQGIAASGDAVQLASALRFLGQPAPSEPGSIRELWSWAVTEWRPKRIPL